MISAYSSEHMLFWTYNFWRMRLKYEIILWDASYFRHSKNIHTEKALLQKLLMELQ